MAAKKTALVILADGAEEMEAVIAIDVMRRGGIDVTVASLQDAQEVVKCSRDVQIKPDVVGLKTVVEAGSNFDAIVLPGGGKGAENLASSAAVGDLLRAQESAGRLIGAICAAPTALLAHGVGKGKKVTSYPAFKEKLVGDYSYQEENVVVDLPLITSRGPATSFHFGVSLVENIAGKEAADPLPKAMLMHLI